METRSGMSRRVFLAGTASTLGALGLGLGNLSCKQRTREGEVVPALTKETPIAYGDWRNIYRDKWRWDKVVKSSHFVNCWYQAHCSWNVYVKDGVVWREEQVARYEQTNADVPDPNPRGCQKGGCFSDRMYEAGRVKYPLKRVGPRGSGQWKRISWEEANLEIADKMLDIVGETKLLDETGLISRIIDHLAFYEQHASKTTDHRERATLMFEAQHGIMAAIWERIK